jgi:hypothetical protein
LSYINFDPATSEIIAVANQPFDDSNSFEIDYNIVKHFLTGDSSTNDYFVDFNYREHLYVVKLKEVESAYFDVSNTFYKVPETYDPSSLLISQTDSELAFIAHPDMQEKFASNIECNVTLRFSICAKNDPRRVYHIVEVQTNELASGIHTVRLTLPKNGVSIYTTKKLESYAHNRL